jgi:prophage antirepressor-like protein
MVMNELVTIPHAFQFNGAQIRVFDIEEYRVAVGADICAALDIKNSRDAIAKLDDDDKLTLRRSEAVGSTDTIWQQFDPRVHTVTLITEDGATDLVLESRKPAARMFRRWLTHEVWPAIRETGSYSIAPALEGPELLARAVLEAQKVIAARDARIAELEPKALMATKILDADGDYSVRDAAQELSRAGIKVGQQRLFIELERKGWISRAREDGRYRPRQKVIDAGYMSVLPQSHHHPHTGELVLDPPQCRVTQKGVERLLTDMGKWRTDAQ